MDKPLDRFELWAVGSHMKKIEADGGAITADRIAELRHNGYFRIAAAVAARRLEYLRAELRAERISYSELFELESLVGDISPNDVELLEAAGVPEQKAD